MTGARLRTASEEEERGRGQDSPARTARMSVRCRSRFLTSCESSQRCLPVQGPVLLGEPLLGAMQPLIDHRYRASENLRDLSMRQAFPGCQRENFAIVAAEGGGGPQDPIELGSLDDHRLRIRLAGVALCRGPAGEVSEPAGASPPPIKHSPGDDEQPGMGGLPRRHLLDAPPGNGENLVGGVVAVLAGAPSQAIGQDGAKVLLVELIEATIRSRPHRRLPGITQAENLLLQAYVSGNTVVLTGRSHRQVDDAP